MSKRLTIEEFIKTLSKGGSGGGSGDVLVVNEIEDDNGSRLDKTWQEIHDAMKCGRVVARYADSPNEELLLVLSVIVQNGSYTVSTVGDDLYSSNSSDGYPIKE